MNRDEPSFKLDKQRLRTLRQEKRGYPSSSFQTPLLPINRTGGVTALRKRGPPTISAIERTGSTSRKTAEAIARALDVSLAFLEGKEVPDSADYLRQIAKLIGKKIAKGDNEALLSALSDECTKPRQGIDWPARPQRARIESVQLGRNPEEIADLVAYVGLSESELLTPANLKGHWFITISSRVCNRSDILHGRNRLARSLRRKGIFEECRAGRGSQSGAAVRHARSE